MTGSAVAASLSLSDLVERTGVPASTIHHYRRSGLIPPPRRQSPNRFAYGEEHVQALLEIRSHTGAGHDETRARIVAAAIDAFRTRSYAEVSMSDVADAVGIAKGSVYRFFESKEALLTAAIETLLDATTERFEDSLRRLEGPDSLDSEPDRSAIALGYVVAEVLPILLELGARAAKGHEPSAELARKVLRTLAATAGRPFLPPGSAGDSEAAVQAGLQVIESGFATVMSWAVGTDWPPDHAASRTTPPDR